MVPQYEFEKGTWWRDGFWRYARFKNMPFFLGSHVRGGGGGGGGSLYLVFYGSTGFNYGYNITMDTRPTTSMFPDMLRMRAWSCCESTSNIPQW